MFIIDGLYGIDSVKVEPTPFSETTVIFPPNNSAFSFAIDKPRPKPPNFCESSFSTCENLSNMVFCFWESIPTPVSLTKISKKFLYLSILLILGLKQF